MPNEIYSIAFHWNELICVCFASRKVILILTWLPFHRVVTESYSTQSGVKSHKGCSSILCKDLWLVYELQDFFRKSAAENMVISSFNTKLLLLV